jgi:hypothetical protein
MAKELRHLILLREQLDAHVGVDVRRQILPDDETIAAGAPPKRKAEWARKITVRLDKHVKDKDVLRGIRHGCACEVSQRQMQMIKAARKRHDDLDDVLAELNQTGLHGNTVREENTLHVAFGNGRCVCGVISQNDVPLSPTFCECCNGHVEKLWALISGSPVHSDMLETHNTGGHECRFDVRIAPAPVDA